jgi:hypothetical protein
LASLFGCTSNAANDVTSPQSPPDDDDDSDEEDDEEEENEDDEEFTHDDAEVVHAEVVEAIPAPDNAIPDTHAEVSPSPARERSSNKNKKKSKDRRQTSFEGADNDDDDGSVAESLRSGRSMHSMHSMRSMHSTRSAANMYPPGMYAAPGQFVPFQNAPPAPYNYPIPPLPTRDWDEMSNQSDSRSVGSRMSMRSTGTASSRRHHAHPNPYHRAQSVPLMVSNQVMNVQPQMMMLGGSMMGMPGYDSQGLARHHSAPPSYNLGGDSAYVTGMTSADSMHSHRNVVNQHGFHNPAASLAAPPPYVPPPGPRSSLYGSGASGYYPPANAGFTSSIQSTNRTAPTLAVSSSSIPARTSTAEEEAAIERAIMNSLQDEEQRRKNLEADRIAIQKGLQRSMVERNTAPTPPANNAPVLPIVRQQNQSTGNNFSSNHKAPSSGPSYNNRGPPGPNGPDSQNGQPRTSHQHRGGMNYGSGSPSSPQNHQQQQQTHHPQHNGAPYQSYPSANQQPSVQYRGSGSGGPSPSQNQQNYSGSSQSRLNNGPPLSHQHQNNHPPQQHQQQQQLSRQNASHQQQLPISNERPFNKPPPAMPVEEPTLSYTSIYDN